MPTISPVATLYAVLQQVQASAKDNAALLRKNEAATRAALIDPVLRALGWDTANVQMVEPEKTIGGDLRVDYLLRDTTGKPHLVIEAKCLDASLDKHGYVSKVLGYALGFKVQTVFITDGLNWHCYSNLHQGNTEATTFSLTDNLLPAALHLIQWLDAAQSGYGIEQPKDSLPKASAMAPASSIPFSKTADKSNKPIVAEQHNFVELTHINTLRLDPGQKPKQLKLPDGSVVPLKTWKDILEKSCEFILQHNQTIPLPYPDKAGKKRFLLTHQKPESGSSTLSAYMNKPIFIYTHYSATDCIANALHMLKLTPQSLQKTIPGVTF